MNTKQAIAHLATLTTVEAVQAFAATETRKGVLAAVEQRLAELSAEPPPPSTTTPPPPTKGKGAQKASQPAEEKPDVEFRSMAGTIFFRGRKYTKAQALQNPELMEQLVRNRSHSLKFN